MPLFAESWFGAWPMRLLVFGILFFSAAGLAQLAPREPQTAYEGQNVSSVSLMANPHRDLTALYPVVIQKVGTPYSEANIEGSAQALKKAGRFADVQINVEPEVSGLRVSFLLEPAYYLGMVEFPGIGKYFAYTRLLQVVNLPDEDPYDPSRIPAGEDALREFLRRNGYFLAKVRHCARCRLHDGITAARVSDRLSGRILEVAEGV